jgi:hypothetical protein
VTPFQNPRWLPFLNAASDECPACAVVEITGATADGVLTVQRPTGHAADYLHAVAGNAPTASGS